MLVVRVVVVWLLKLVLHVMLAVFVVAVLSSVVVRSVVLVLVFIYISI